MNFTFPEITSDFYIAALPVFILCIGSLVVLMQAVMKRFGSPTSVFTTLMITLLAALISSLTSFPTTETAYLQGAYLIGQLGQFGQTLILVIAILVTLLFKDTFLRARFFRGEIASLFLMIIMGMLVMIASEDLITLFVGLELSSIGLYAVVGYLNPSRRSQEGAIKYFVLGSFASGLLLFAFGLIYIATGSMRLSEIVEIAPRLTNHIWLQVGAIFLLSGLGFKLALAPFHLWAPDTYEAAPTGITALMATTVKIMIMIVTLRFFTSGLASVYEVWMPALMFLAIASMIIGNIMALVQTSLKRMLAYSSIAHSGYMAIAICALGGGQTQIPTAAVLFYLLGYSVISVGAFGVLMWLESEDNDNLHLDNIAGLAKRHPWAAAALAVCMFSFAGMPPTVGFLGKFFVFNAALQNKLYSLVIIGVIGSSISLFYYLRVIVKMYMAEPSKKSFGSFAPTRSVTITAIMAVSIILSVLLGTVLPSSAMRSMLVISAEVAQH